MEAIVWLLIVAAMIGVAVAPAFPRVRRRLGLTEDTAEAQTVRRFLASPLKAIKDERGGFRRGADVAMPSEPLAERHSVPLLAYPQQPRGSSETSELATHVELLQRDWQIFAEAGDRWAAANVLNMIGFVYERQGKFEDAIGLHEQAVDLFRETDDPVGEGDSLNNLGVVLGRMGGVETGVEKHSTALAMREGVDGARAANSNNNLGVLFAGSDQGRALSYFAKAETLAREAGDKRVWGKVINNSTVLALDRSEEGELDELRLRLEQCLPLRDGSADPRGTAKTMNNLGVLFTRFGDVQAAERAFNDAATLAGVVEDHVGLLHMLENWLMLTEASWGGEGDPNWLGERISNLRDYALPARSTLEADCESYAIKVGDTGRSQVALLSSGSATPADPARLEELLARIGLADQ